jgi:hypothetical protein
MNQRGGSCEWLRDSTKLAFRKFFGLLMLVGILSFSRFAHAQGSVIFYSFDPQPGDYLGQGTNFYPNRLTNIVFSPVWGSNGDFVGFTNIAFPYVRWDSSVGNEKLFAAEPKQLRSASRFFFPLPL